MIVGPLPPAEALDALLHALDHAGIGCTVVVERNGTPERTYASAAFASMLGLSPEAALALLPMQLLSASDRERAEAFRRSMASGDAIETVVARPDGTKLPVEVRVGTASFSGGRAVFAFLRDRTKNAELEDELRASEERFRLVAESSPDSISITAGGRFVYANPVAMQLLGITSQDQLAGVDPMSQVPDDQLDAVRARAAALARGERPPPMQFRIPSREPGGTERVLEASTSIGQLHGERAALSYARDITERVRLQAELMKQDRLASIGMLAAGVAHELNNPLASLALQTQRLLSIAKRHDELPADVKDGLEQIEEASRRMTSIISDFLFMSRPTSQPQAHIDLKSILTSTVALVRASRSRPRFELALDDLPAIEGYASKLGQVFLNVLLNALQAVEDKDGSTVKVSGHPRGDDVEIRVEDDGPGIPPDVLPHLTQPFFTTKPQGTGLGLWISTTLVAQHGGRLDVVSEPGRGTTVIVRLPTRLP